MTKESILAKTRKEKGILASFVAEKTGISRPAYSNYESGKASIPAEIAVKICDLLNVKVDDIFLPSAFIIRK